MSKVKSAATWSKASFKIARKLGSHEEKGYVSIYFGIHKSPPGFTCTHLATGTLVSKLPTLKLSKLFCEELSRLGDWTAIKLSPAGKAYGNDKLIQDGRVIQQKYCTLAKQKDPG